MKLTEPKTKSAFWRLVLNNKFVASLVVILLILTIIYMLKKVDFIFAPLATFTGAVGAPIVVAGIFYYILNPIVDWLEIKYKIKRLWTTVGLFIGLTILIVWGIAVLVPVIRDQIESLAHNWPKYWEAITNEFERWTADRRYKALNQWFTSTNTHFSDYFKQFSANSVLKISSVFGTLTTIVITIVTFPLVLFYLLKDGHNLPKYMAQFFPISAQASFKELLTEINLQISNYIRGQLSVAFAVGVMFAIGYTIIGLPYGWLIAFFSGILNLIPFLGSFLAIIPALIVGIFVSPMMLVAVIIVFIIEQTLEGKVISPKLLGNSLKIHPVTVVVILLSAGNLFGLLGVIFGIPGYAIAKVLLSRIYLWWKGNSNLFDDDPANDGTTVEIIKPKGDA
ncbi:MAG: AI-2E family transporter [Lactobacillaceae bacterium]|jgi:predicted PurR-regulated permease PerM|nr:AI-2E family transporter [Lactobacillaceae bacterium]